MPMKMDSKLLSPNKISIAIKNLRKGYSGSSNFNKLTHSSSQKYIKHKKPLKSKEKVQKRHKKEIEGKQVKYSKIDLSLMNQFR